MNTPAMNVPGSAAKGSADSGTRARYRHETRSSRSVAGAVSRTFCTLLPPLPWDLGGLEMGEAVPVRKNKKKTIIEIKEQKVKKTKVKEFTVRIAVDGARDCDCDCDPEHR